MDQQGDVDRQHFSRAETIGQPAGRHLGQCVGEKEGGQDDARLLVREPEIGAEFIQLGDFGDADAVQVKHHRGQRGRSDHVVTNVRGRVAELILRRVRTGEVGAELGFPLTQSPHKIVDHTEVAAEISTVLQFAAAVLVLPGLETGSAETKFPTQDRWAAADAPLR